MNAITPIETPAGSALIVIAASEVSTVIAADESDILGKLATKIAAFKPDISTPKGRKEIASIAAEVASSKMDLLRLGKALTEDWRKSTDAVRAECRIIEDRMDALKAQVRQPLTDFENAEKARIKGHEDALACLAAHPDMQRATSAELSEAISARLEPEARNWQEFHQRALDAHAAAIKTLRAWRSDAEEREEQAAELARLQAAEAERQRLAAIEAQRIREERIAAEAAEAARAAAEAKAKREADEAAHAAQRAQEAARKALADAEAKAASERLEAERTAREMRERAVKAEADRVSAVEAAERARVAAAQKAERDQAAAVEAERQRVAAEAAAQEAAAAKRAANLAHKGKINREALAAIVVAVSEVHTGSVEDAQKIGTEIIKAIVLGKIPHIKIGY